MTHESIIPYTLIKAVTSFSNIYELRLFGWCIAKAQSILKTYDKNLQDINIEHGPRVARVTMPARYLLNDGDTNYRNIRKAFTLATKAIEYKTEFVHYQLNIIAFPEEFKRNGQRYISFVIHQELWFAMVNFSKGYRMIYLPVFMQLQSAYTAAMYILVSNQTASITYNLDNLRTLLGCDGKQAYKRTYNLIAKVIEPAMKELDEKAPYTFRYGMKRTGRGGGYHDITIYPQQNPNFSAVDPSPQRTQHIEQQRIKLEEDVIWYLQDGFMMKANEIEQIEGMLSRVGTRDRQISYLATVKEGAIRRRIANRAGYLVQALRNYKG